MSQSATPPSSQNSRRRTRDGRAPERSLTTVRLPSALIRACCRKCQQFDFPKGQHLYYEGHDSYGLFVVGAGHIRLARDHATPGDGTVVGPGSLLGVKELLTGAPNATAAIVSSDHAKVCFIDKTAFFAMITAQEPLGHSILRALLRD